MSHFLLPSSPIYGHVTPMIAVGRALAARGHSVTVLTGTKYADAVRAAGLGFRALPGEADYDDAHLETWLPERSRLRGVAAGRYDILNLFIRPLVAQHRALTAALADEPCDAVVCEAAFLGVLPLLAQPPDRRPPVLGVSATPLALSSTDCAPFGAGLEPDTTAHGRFRNWLIDTVLQRGPLRPVQVALDDALAEAGAPPAEGTYFDQATRFDLTFQLATPGIEYPRREMPDTVRFVGPLRRAVAPGARAEGERAAAEALPPWWGELDGSRPVVHVTQGTMANADLTRLMVPTVRALAEEDVLVVACTGGRPPSRFAEQYGGPLPANLRVASFLPYEQLLPRTDVMVTNGGFGGVQQALAHGVPLVVAGSTEDKPEVAARVSWSGVGVNLRTGSPAPWRVRRAVRRVLARPRFRQSAARLQAEIARLGDPTTTIATAVTSLVADRDASAGDRPDVSTGPGAARPGAPAS